MGAVFQGNQPAPDDERTFFFTVRPELIIYGLTELENEYFATLNKRNDAGMNHQ